MGVAYVPAPHARSWLYALSLTDLFGKNALADNSATKTEPIREKKPLNDLT